MENIALKEIATRVSIEGLRGGVAGRYSFPGLLVVTATVLACHLVPACRQTQPTVDCSTRYSLEVANDAAGRVRIRFGIGGQASWIYRPASRDRDLGAALLPWIAEIEERLKSHLSARETRRKTTFL